MARLNESAIPLAVRPSTAAREAVRTKPVTLLAVVPRVMTEAPLANEAGLSPCFPLFFFGF